MNERQTKILALLVMTVMFLAIVILGLSVMTIAYRITP